MRYIDTNTVVGRLAERGLNIAQWAKMSGFDRHQVYTALNGKAGKPLAYAVAKKLVADGLLDSVPDIAQATRFPQQKQRWWTTQQVATWVGVSVDCIRNWMAGRHVDDFPRPVRIGSVLRFDSVDLEKWMDKRKGVENGRSEAEGKRAG